MPGARDASLIRAFNQLPFARERLAAGVRGAEVVDVVDGPPPPGVTAEVAFAGWDYERRVRELVGRGVQWLQLPGTGIDEVPAWVFDEFPTVTCARGASAVPIAEYVLAVMLAAVKDLPRSWLAAPPKHWNFQRLGALEDQTLGLVGLGGIGTAVATRARAFGMRVRAVRRTDAPSPVDGVELVTQLRDLVVDVDHLVLCAPATRRTARVVDDALLARVRPGVHLVNVARGTLVDQDALRRALDAGTVGRASLDVCDPEPLPPGHWLYDHPKVFLTPHSSWASPRGLDRATDLFVANLERYVAGEPLHGVVDPSEGY